MSIANLRDITEVPDMPIIMGDGCRLSARVWMPADAETAPVPAILEFLPYRKRDGTTARDSLTHPYFAKRGYACIRVDMRGNGDSHGIMEDEYTQQELDDAVHTINWLASQPWCSGSVGGGPLSLHVFSASERSISHCSGASPNTSAQLPSSATLFRLSSSNRLPVLSSFGTASFSTSGAGLGMPLASMYRTSPLLARSTTSFVSGPSYLIRAWSKPCSARAYLGGGL